MNIFLREMKANLKSLFFWCVGVIFLIVVGMVKYKGLSESAELVDEMLSQMPVAMQEMFGLNSFNLTEMSGYYGVFFLYFVLMATIHAAMLGATIISKEERDKTVEFLMTKPSKRSTVVTSKLLATICNALVFNIVTCVTSILFANYYNKGESITDKIMLLMLAMFILQVVFISIGAGIAAITKIPKKATSMSTAILMATYFLSLIVDLNDDFENLKYITPFKYFDAKYIIVEGSFESIFVVISLTIIVVMTSVTYYFYSKRDLNV